MIKKELPTGERFIIIVLGTMVRHLDCSHGWHIIRKIIGQLFPAVFRPGVIISQKQTAVRISVSASRLRTRQIRKEKVIWTHHFGVRNLWTGVDDQGIGIQASWCVCLVNLTDIVPVIGKNIRRLQIGLQCLLSYPFFFSPRKRPCFFGYSGNYMARKPSFSVRFSNPPELFPRGWPWYCPGF